MSDQSRQPAQGILVIGRDEVKLEQIVAVAEGKLRVELSSDEPFRHRMEQAQVNLERALDEGRPVYGVTTGFGGSCGSRLQAQSTADLGQNLLSFHGCGTGEPIGVQEVRASMLCRLLCLAQGYSAVSLGLLEQLAAFLNHHITPVVPSQGSVGASGDLTPLSYVGATLGGERDVFYRQLRMPAAKALELARLVPYRFLPKEPLAIVNGTAVMTGIAALVVSRARKILHAAVQASALSVHGLAGHASHFHPAIFHVKPFEGQGWVAEKLRELLDGSVQPKRTSDPEALQDPYSLRCTPHVLGVLADALPWIRSWVEIEANGVSDNPLIHPDTGEVLTGGNFYGGHIAFAMDGLKSAMASIADLSDRQIALMVDPRFNRGLPSCLVGVEGPEQALHHGFKAMQITASALTAEAQKDTMPAAAFSRSTESHNQDKVSLGTIAARDAARVCEMVTRVVAIHLLAAAQACDLRGNLDSRPRARAVVEQVRCLVPKTVQDRPMDTDMEQIAAAILDGKFLIQT